jgi:hypothetical protein
MWTSYDFFLKNELSYSLIPSINRYFLICILVLTQLSTVRTRSLRKSEVASDTGTSSREGDALQRTRLSVSYEDGVVRE